MTIRRLLGLVCAFLLLPLSVAQADDLGNISFPNSGAPEAQEAFLTGVKALHSFQFDEARFAFEDAQKIDPDFALAYWGQAMSDNHPLWAQQDGDAALAALTRLAPTHEGRLAKAPSEKEKAFLNAIEILYFSEGDKLTRDKAYEAHMAAMQERWPDDDEIAVFRALSLLGIMRPGNRGYRLQARAAAIGLEVFARNPNHPGAAHFVIHAFDDPDHAILALPAARVYAGIAPAAAHALHMPSHIFLQLGMWEGVVNSNIDAYAAAVETNAKFGLAEGREDFHTLSWLAYANLMLGQYERAEANVADAMATLKRNPDSMMVQMGHLDMLGRHILETGDWRALELADMSTMEGRHAHWVSVVGMNAAHRGENDIAMAAENRIKALGKAAMADGNSYDAKVAEVLYREVMAVRLSNSGDGDAAIAAAREAAELEMTTLRMPSGPPKPMKPAGELYADILFENNRPAEAMTAYRESLEWIPQRTPSMRGLAMAAAKVGDSETATDMFEKLRQMPGANLDSATFSALMGALTEQD